MNSGKIDLFIIGAQKAGTTSLKNYLGEHPQITSHTSQEFSFFYDDKVYDKSDIQKIIRTFGADFQSNKKIIAKHANLYSSEKGIQRLYEHNPDCRLIFLLRDPVERAYSSFLMEKLYHRVDFEFIDLIHMLKNSSFQGLETWQKEAILDYGCYDIYLQKVLSIFPRDQVRLILFEDFKLNPLRFCQEIFNDLGIKSDFYPQVRAVHNESSTPRSKYFSQFIRNYLIRENFVKKIFSKIIPNDFQVKAGNFLRDINRSKKGKQSLGLDEIKILKEYYIINIKNLEAITGMDFSAWK